MVEPDRALLVTQVSSQTEFNRHYESKEYSMTHDLRALIKSFTPNNPRYTPCKLEIYRGRRDKHYPVDAYEVAWSPSIVALTSGGSEAPITLSDDSRLVPFAWLTTDGRLVTQGIWLSLIGGSKFIFIDTPDHFTPKDQELLKLGLEGNFEKLDGDLEIASRRNLLFNVELLIRKARSYPRTIPVALKAQFHEILGLEWKSPEYESAKLELLDALIA